MEVCSIFGDQPLLIYALGFMAQEFRVWGLGSRFLKGPLKGDMWGYIEGLGLRSGLRDRGIGLGGLGFS